MANRRPLDAAERRRIVQRIQEGWTKRKLCTEFHRSFGTIVALIAKTSPSNDTKNVTSKNRDKIAVVNIALAQCNNLPANNVNNIKKTLLALQQDLQRYAPELKSFNFNLETGEVALVLTTNLNIKIGA